MSEECPVKEGNVLQEKSRILFNRAALGDFTTHTFFCSLLPFFFAVLIREKTLNQMPVWLSLIQYTR